MTHTLTLPTILTLIRLVGACSIMPLILWLGLPLRKWTVNWSMAAVFTAMGFTDFLDGYLARVLGQETAFGKMLDPLADKFLVCSTLISLIGAGRVSPLFGIIVIGRELFIMGLRELALMQGLMVPVAWAGKIKTTLQFLYIGTVILNNRTNVSSSALFFERFLALSTLFFTLYSALLYYQAYTQIAQ